jgi:hypothetical protein
VNTIAAIQGYVEYCLLYALSADIQQRVERPTNAGLVDAYNTCLRLAEAGREAETEFCRTIRALATPPEELTEPSAAGVAPEA